MERDTATIFRPGSADPRSPDERALDWQGRGACLNTDLDLMFPETGGSVKDAKRICGYCPVRRECLEYALGNDERFGVWGGLSERQRRRVKRQAAPAAEAGRPGKSLVA